ncbi:MAG TPA: hypothetical protein VJ892_00210 [Candidatus Absconditabacterales bacterium]|nr:hypothetical protein [Candidatus Absconditabacterales bacterium]
MIKRIIYILLGVLFVQNSFFSIVFAQSQNSSDEVKCITCSQPSLEFQTYVNFQVELMQVLRKAAREKEEKDLNTRVGLFSSRILSLPKRLLETWKAIFKKESEELTQAWRSAKIGTIMLSSITSEIVTKDGLGGLAILFRSQPFVREWSTLQDLDMSLHDTMWDLGTKGLREQDVSSEIMKDISKLQDKYKSNLSNEYALFVKFDIKGNLKYKDLVNMMLRLNSIMKNFIAIDVERVDTKIIEKNGITMQFNENLMNLMYDNYDCAQGFPISPCDSTWQDFANNTKVRSTIKKGLEESNEIIKKANEELSQAMFSFGSSTKDTFSNKDENNESGLTSRQLTLLRTAYGIDTTKLSKEQGIGLESLLNGSAGKKIVNSIGIKPMDYFSAENKALREEARKEKERNKQDAKYLDALAQSETTEVENKYKDFLNMKDILKKGSFDDITLSSDTFFSDFVKGKYNTMKDKDNKSKQEIIESLYNILENKLGINASVIGLQDSLKSSLNSVLAQKQEDKGVFMIYSNLSVTRYFVEIGDFIHEIVEKDIGTKDDKGLIKYLGNACELQCSNKGNTNCFAQ